MVVPRRGRGRESGAGSGKVAGHWIVIFVVGGDWRAKVFFCFKLSDSGLPKKVMFIDSDWFHYLFLV